MSPFIASLLKDQLKFPERLINVATAYLLMIILPAHKHSQTAAAKLSKLHRSQFSRLLGKPTALAKDTMLQLSQRVAAMMAPTRKPLFSGAPWTLALIIDSTLHQRSSLHVRNSQRFNHGQGFVIGHQWTNVALVICGIVIPLPPIPFYSKNECKRRGISYKTEHDCLDAYLKNLRLSKWIGPHNPKEVVALLDSGYDCKSLQNRIMRKGWDFVSALKSNRSVQTLHESQSSPKLWRCVQKLFLAAKKQAPWETVRDHVDGGKKRKEFRARRLIGYLKGVTSPVAIVCSEKSKGKGRKFLASSNTKVSTSVLVRAYRRRWAIELFHRTIKDQLGLQDAGVTEFDALVNHMHWVYSAYLILLLETGCKAEVSLLARQREIADDFARAPSLAVLKDVAQMSDRFGGQKKIKQHCAAALRAARAA